MPARILIADDHRLIREGIRALVRGTRDMVVVGEAGDGRTAVELVRKLLPNVVIIDVSIPGLNGIDAARRIHEEFPHVRIIALTMSSDRHCVAGMLEAGASGYLLKTCPAEEIIRAVREVARGGTAMSQRVVDTAMVDYASLLKGKRNRPEDLLTPREREVLRLVAEGAGTHTVAGHLQVSCKTVSAHRHRIMRKLKVNSVAELTLFALREGLIAPDAEREILPG